MESHLQGQVALSTWLSIAELEQLTGELILGDERFIQFQNGYVVGARCGSAYGPSAVGDLFIANPTQGALGGAARDANPIVESPLHWDATTATLYGLRRADEWQDVHAAVYATVTGEGPAALADLWRWFDGHRTLAEVVWDQGRSPSSILDALFEAVRSGALRAAAPPNLNRAKAAGESIDPAAFWALMDEAHEALRQRQYAEAERALRRALRARPEDPTAKQNLRRVLRLVAQET